MPSFLTVVYTVFLRQYLSLRDTKNPESGLKEANELMSDNSDILVHTYFLALRL